MKIKQLLTICCIFPIVTLSAQTKNTVFKVSGNDAIEVVMKNDPAFGNAEKINDTVYIFRTPTGYVMTIAFFDAKTLSPGMTIQEIKDSLRAKESMGALYEKDDYYYIFYTLKRTIDNKPAVGFFTRGVKGSIMFGFDIKVLENEVTEKTSGTIDDLYKKVAARLQIEHVVKDNSSKVSE